MRKSISLFGILIAMALTLSMTSCRETKEDKAEEAIEEVEDAAEDVGDGIEDAAEDVEDEVEDATDDSPQ
ncbi:hypothetical protein K1F50_05030 [Muricauda oceani]|uniref:YtxH domain-containing protein n=1 Tax=Flagellimonas oceani TaxID=2698672 RepID=A0A6G7J552_9FLAO|nr:hypothetical protein [Allomuricauda oceani]MBW8242152.1 hypothetical protein [Allomuricauda oceani]QII45916.1 hypothetical protein GVT53_14955 [Allomuricauda oceani]